MIVLLLTNLFCRWAIPMCLFTSWLYMRTKYHWTQVLVGFGLLRVAIFHIGLISQGVAISIGGLCLLVVSDLVTGKDGHAERRGLGDALILIAATIFGICAYSDEYITNQVTYLSHSECNRRVLRETFTSLRGAFAIQYFCGPEYMNPRSLDNLGCGALL